MGAEIQKAKRRLGLKESAEVRSCYEAGREGFWLHRALEQMGIDNMVVDASSIEVNRRQRRAKTDRMDMQPPCLGDQGSRKDKVACAKIFEQGDDWQRF